LEYDPFSLYVKIADLTSQQQAEIANRPPSSLDAVGFTFYADLYRACAGLMSPVEVDECELWQIGALLGIDRKETADDELARIAASIPQGEGPVDVTAQVMASMNLQTR
jgi:hypothetical protein